MTMIEDNVQPVSRQDLVTALQVFVSSLDDDESNEDEVVDTRIALLRVAKATQIDDPYGVLALFNRCVAIQNAAQDGLFEAAEDGAVPDQAVEVACILPVIGNGSEPTAMRFDRDQFKQAMQCH
jgi:hypothetical protein